MHLIDQGQNFVCVTLNKWLVAGVVYPISHGIVVNRLRLADYRQMNLNSKIP